LRNEPQKEIPNDGQRQASSGASSRAEKVRSSRYEWEGKSNENGNAAGAANGARRSILSSIKIWLKKLNAGNSNFFDNDDDASPSAA